MMFFLIIAWANPSGPDVGPSYAGSFIYDKFTNALYSMTGVTHRASNGPGIEANQASYLDWQERATYRAPNVDEACNALTFTSYEGKNAAVVVGST
jgi:hypothetical protein